MEISQYNKILEDLRQLYRDGKFEDLRKKYVLCSWMLKNEDREKIESIIGQQFRKPSPGEQSVIDEALKIGCKIIE